MIVLKQINILVPVLLQIYSIECRTIDEYILNTIELPTNEIESGFDAEINSNYFASNVTTQSASAITAEILEIDNLIYTKRYKIWGWNPLNVVKDTFKNVQTSLNEAVKVVQKTGQDAVDSTKNNVEKAIIVVQNSGQDVINKVTDNAENVISTGQQKIQDVQNKADETIVVIQQTGQNAVEGVKTNSAQAIVIIQKATQVALDNVENAFQVVYKTGQKTLIDTSNFASGSINVVQQNGVQMTVIISKNVIDPLKNNVEIIINDEETIQFIKNAALEGTCAALRTVTGVPGAVVTGVACEVIRQINENGFEVVAEKIKNGDVKFISKVILKGACGGLAVKGKIIVAVATEEVCTVVEIIIDKGVEKFADDIVSGDDKIIDKLLITGACGGIGSVGGVPGAAVTAAGCSVVNDLNEKI